MSQGLYRPTCRLYRWYHLSMNYPQYRRSHKHESMPFLFHYKYPSSWLFFLSPMATKWRSVWFQQLHKSYHLLDTKLHHRPYLVHISPCRRIYLIQPYKRGCNGHWSYQQRQPWIHRERWRLHLLLLSPWPTSISASSQQCQHPKQRQLGIYQPIQWHM